MLTLSNKCCTIIAEVAQAHDGSLGTAHAYIDAVADAGADAIKFQTHIAEAESTPAEPWRIKFSKQDESRFDYWKRMEFTEAQWQGLKDHADEKGLLFLSSPFSVEAVELLTRVGVAAWKIASGEVSNAMMFEVITETNLPILLSTGMSSWSEIDTAAEMIQDKNLPLAVLQCTSSYPTPPEKIGLNVLSEFRQRYGCAVGLSDHSGNIYPSLAAAALGIEVLEIHVTFSRDMFGPDVIASITTSELKQLVGGVRFVETMRNNPVDKDAAAEEMLSMRNLFTKSIVVKADLKKDTPLAKAHLTTKKPGTGIPADQLNDLIGRKLKQPVKAGDFLSFDDLL